MTRQLDFDDLKGQQRFTMCRWALLSGGDGKGSRARDVIRKEARLLDAFDEISEPGPEDTRTLRATSLSLRQEDFELLVQYVDSTPWVPRAARDAVDVQDWLSAADKFD